MPYIGKSPSVGLRTRYNYTATAGQTSFSGADNNNVTLTYTDTNYSDVYLNGTLLLAVTDYASTTGTSIVLTSGASLNDVLEVVVYDIFSVADTVSATDGGTFSSNVGFGADISSSTLGTSNFRAGVNAGNSITSGGNYNVTVGDEAGTAITTGDNNSAVGYNSLAANTTGTLNTAVGKDAGLSVTTGGQNTLIGASSGDALTTGGNNVAVGISALSSDTSGGKSVGIGYAALLNQNQTGGADAFNTAVGASAGLSVTTGIENTIIGALAGDALTDTDYNVAIGKESLTTDTLGSRSTAIGFKALKTQNFTSATETLNVAVGFAAGENVTTGIQNTLIGANAGTQGTDLTTGNNNILLGYLTGTSAADSLNQFVIGVNVSGGENEQITIGTSAGVVQNEFDTDAAWTRTSDVRLKTDIADATLGLDFINDLRTVTYKWKASNDLDQNDPQLEKLYNSKNQMNTTATMHGLIAQEVKTALDTAGVDTFKGWKENPDGVQNISREMYVLPLIKAVQELSTALDAALARIATLEG